MILYNVTIKVDSDIADDWVRWMKAEHMPDLMNTGLFTDSRLSRLLQQDETEGITYVAQYTCNTLDDYNNYIDNHAPQIRSKWAARYGDGLPAFRTVMEII